MLPSSLQYRIQSLLETTGDKSSLIMAREQLTQRYRSKQGGERRGFLSHSEVVAYVAARLPATFASIEEILPHVPLKSISSVLDLGAGPGTAALAAALYWPECQKIHLIEENAFMGGISQTLLKGLPEFQDRQVSFQKANLLSMTVETSYDLVLLSYVLNELAAHEQETVLRKAWSIAEKGLIIVVPGTPVGYQQLMTLRDLLMEAGAFIAAPCPHHEVCPLKEGDWCHFSARLLRSSFHRKIKNVSLPFEDEKYSYLVALREPVQHHSARIIRKPLQRSGHVTLDLCAPGGIKRQTVSKRDKEHYRLATKAAWGDGWDDHLSTEKE